MNGEIFFQETGSINFDPEDIQIASIDQDDMDNHIYGKLSQA